MDHAINVRVRREDFVKLGFVGDVHGVELWALAREQLDPVEAFLGSIVQVIDNDDLVASLK